jgi:hypothetical protein
VCICTCLNSHVHLILLTIKLQTEPEQNSSRIARQRRGIPYYEFPTHYAQPARNHDYSADTDMTKSAFRHPATKNYAATHIVKNETTHFSIPHQFSNSKTAAPTSCNPFYFIPISEKAQKLRPTLINSDNYKISSTKCDTSRIYQDLDIARIPTPYRFDRHPSPFTFASETFEPLFSHYRNTNSAYACLSTTTGLTNFIEAMSSDHPDPYQLDTPFVPQPTDGTLDPIHQMPFLQHNSDLDSRTNPNAALLYYPDATLQDNINGPLTMQHLPACIDTSITAATFCLRYITANLASSHWQSPLNSP